MLKDDIARLKKEVEEGQELIRSITRKLRSKRKKINKYKANLQIVLQQNSKAGYCCYKIDEATGNVVKA